MSTLPDDPQAPKIPLEPAYDAIFNYVFFQDVDGGEPGADSITARLNQLEDAYAHDPRMLVELLQFRLDYLIKDDEVLPALYAAVARWPDVPAIRLLLVRSLAAMKRVPEAEVVLTPLVEARCIDAFDRVYDLALLYHLTGRHRDGLRMLSVCELISPGVGKNASLVKLKRIANELRDLRIPFNAVKRFRQDRILRNLGWTAVVLGALLLLLLMGLGIGSLLVGSSTAR